MEEEVLIGVGGRGYVGGGGIEDNGGRLGLEGVIGDGGYYRGRGGGRE